jgi:D-alanyl-lipoteichoic acid acyltransferase DltB (MBOAT superfamily)
MSAVLVIIFHCFWHWAGAAFLLTIVANTIVAIIRAIANLIRPPGNWAKVESL